MAVRNFCDECGSLRFGTPEAAPTRRRVGSRPMHGRCMVAPAFPIDNNPENHR